jgi:hypothetical protein
MVPQAGFEPATVGLEVSFASCIMSATRYFMLRSSRHAVIAAPRGASSHHDSHHACTQGVKLDGFGPYAVGRSFSAVEPPWGVEPQPYALRVNLLVSAQVTVP